MLCKLVVVVVVNVVESTCLHNRCPIIAYFYVPLHIWISIVGYVTLDQHTVRNFLLTDSKLTLFVKYWTFIVKLSIIAHRVH